MFNLFYEGGPLFMGILTIILIALIAVAVYAFIRTNKGSSGEKSISLVKEIGIFGLVVGILGQLIGLVQAFDAIERAADISPALLFHGLKISMITTLYGFIICIIGWLLYFGLKAKLAQE